MQFAKTDFIYSACSWLILTYCLLYMQLAETDMLFTLQVGLLYIFTCCLLHMTLACRLLYKQFAEIDLQFPCNLLRLTCSLPYMQLPETDMQFTCNLLRLTCSWLRSEIDMQFTLHAAG